MHRDYPGVTAVVQVGVASGREQYVHRIGRTARAGKAGSGFLTRALTLTLTLTLTLALTLTLTLTLALTLGGRRVPAARRVRGALPEAPHRLAAAATAGARARALQGAAGRARDGARRPAA